MPEREVRESVTHHSALFPPFHLFFLRLKVRPVDRFVLFIGLMSNPTAPQERYQEDPSA